jgi:exopolysaccharide biosynthesis polyprenyl glycosylphosphotransferase
VSDTPTTSKLHDAAADPRVRAGDLRPGRVGLSLPASERRLVLVLLDLAALNGGLMLTLLLHDIFPISWTLIGRNPGWLVALNALWFLFAFALDAYDLRRASVLTAAVPSVLQAGALTLLAYLLIPQLSPPLPRSRLVLLAFVAVVLALLVLGRVLYTTLLSSGHFQRRMLIVGAGWAGRTIAQVAHDEGGRGYDTVGFVDDDPDKLGKAVRVAAAGTRGKRDGLPAPRVLGDRAVIPTLVKQYHVNTVVLAITHRLNAEFTQVLMDCLEQGVEIVPMAVMYEQLTGRVPIEHVGDSWYISMPIHHSGTGNLYPMAKRLLDLLLAVLGLFVLAVVLPFVALAIRLDSPGPVFYLQDRVGKAGTVFRVIKFRTMVAEAEQDGPVWAQLNDRRMTRVGRFLRRVHLDELPQAINVLRGEMSAVGPRPERPEFIERLAEKIPFYRVRHAVKPGMAGWGFVHQSYASSTEDTLIKLQYDLYYIKHQSIWLDLVILLKTVIQSLSFSGR